MATRTSPEDLGTTTAEQMAQDTEEIPKDAPSKPGEKMALSKELSGLKRSITNQIKIIKTDLSPKGHLVSRTALRRKNKVLEDTLTDLLACAVHFKTLDLSSKELDWIENYISVERNRVIDVSGELLEHVEARAHEQSTIFGQEDGFMSKVNLLDQTKVTLGDGNTALQARSVANDDEERERLRNRLEELELGSRAGDFQDKAVPRRPDATMSKPAAFQSWMAQPVMELGMETRRSYIKSEMPVFSGDPLDFIDWSNMFHAVVHCSPRSAAEKMGLLRSSLSPECREVVKGFTNSETHYLQAIQALHNRYGCQHLLERAHLQAIRDLPSVRSNDVGLSFTRFADQLQGHLRVATSMLPDRDGLLTALMFDLEHKLDRASFRHWRDYASSIPREEKIYHFARWASEQASELRYFNIDRSSVGKDGPRTENKKFIHQIESDRQACPLCKAPHAPRECKKFKEVNPYQRRELAWKTGMCFRCLNLGHRAFECPRKDELNCRKDGCSGTHHTWLHIGKRESSSTEANKELKRKPESESVHQVQINTCGGTKLGIIPLECTNGRRSMMINALVDEGSDVTLVSKKVAKKLKIQQPKQQTMTMNLLSQDVRCKTGSVDLTIRGFNENKTFLVQAFTMDRVCNNLRSFAWRSVQGQFDHLSDLPLTDLEGEVDMLIGVDHLDLISPLEVRRGGLGEPIAIHCALGWVIRGQASELDRKDHQHSQVHFTQAKLNLEAMMKTLFDSEHFGGENVGADSPVWSQEEAYGMKLIRDGTRKLIKEPGYEVTLPWRGGHRPKNDPIAAKRRYDSILKKMKHNGQFALDYREAMGKYLNQGYARKVEDKEATDLEQRWLPHHGVYKQSNPKKLRIVFDSAAKYFNMSLNDCLYTGPALQNDLVVLLLGFREFEIAVTSDIEAMYSRIRMDSRDARYHRFLWEVEPGGEIGLFEMTGVVFGDSSSPCQAIHVLQRTAEEFGSPEVLERVQSRFYMDDYLDSFPSEDEAIMKSRSLSETLRHGNFNLTKWMSNSLAVTNVWRQKGASRDQSANVDLGQHDGKILGMIWQAEKDHLSFSLQPFDLSTSSFTRRYLLSKLSGVFDPMGLAAPFTVKGKIPMQTLIKLEKDWDEQVEEREQAWWKKWIQGITNMKATTVHRCLRPNWAKEIQLHAFCDASVEAFAAVIYLRLTSSSDHVETRIVMAKTRVAPLKPISVAKLELNAAVLACRLVQVVEKSLRGPIHKRIFWTDSSAVRGWIRGTSSFYRTFVSNRIGEIQTLSCASEWRHVPGRLNPADYATRSEITELPIPDEWLNGPKFLELHDEEWPPDIKVEKNLDDIKKEFNTFHVTTNTKNKFPWYESLHSLEDALVKEDQDYEDRPTCLNKLVQRSQEDSFGEEMALVRNKKPLKRSSRLLSLSPILDDQGTLRVGGRIDRAQVPYEARHPIVLDPHHPLTTLILDDIHQESNHAGLNHMLTILRQRYHVLRGREALKKTKSRCSFCKKRDARPLHQLMGELPEQRLEVPAPPFSRISVDCFGPYKVLISRNKTDKRWGLIFACLTTRAIHLEVLQGLNEEDFLLAFRVFENLRGRPLSIYSDNGTNFVAASKTLKKKIGLEWTFQPPNAPHWGGVHEALIKSVKRALDGVLEREGKSMRFMKSEELRLVFSEVTGFLNSRPLTYEGNHPNEPTSLTPNHFLLQRPNPIIPAGDFVSLNPRKHFHYLEGVIESIWKRWIHEYLPNLITRPKWRREEENLEVGDSVLIVDPQVPRGEWRSGRVIAVHPGRDGKVRTVTLETNGGTKTRPITRLCILEKTQSSPPLTEVIGTQGEEDVGANL